MIKINLIGFNIFQGNNIKLKKMDGFSYYNIFETKGIEYIIIITFLIMIIPFWIIINKKALIKKQIKKAFEILSTGILKIPQGIFYSNNHTWTFLEKSGNAAVGLNDLLLHLTGEVSFRNLRNPGNFVKKGDLLAAIEQDGKLLQIYSPISGSITKTNTTLYDSPELLNDDPYGKGWVYKIKPSAWIEETESYYLAEGAVVWVKKELERFKDFLAVSLKKYSPETSMVILQDGGELCDKPLSELPEEVWKDFQKSFLN
jgi:glycine cleavage system H protein